MFVEPDDEEDKTRQQQLLSYSWTTAYQDVGDRHAIRDAATGMVFDRVGIVEKETKKIPTQTLIPRPF